MPFSTWARTVSSRFVRRVSDESVIDQNDAHEDTVGDVPPDFSLEHYDVQLAESCERNEKSKPLKQCIKEEWPLIVASIGFSGAIIMEGYCMSLITGLFAFSSFKQDYGEESNGVLEIPYARTVFLPMAAQVGQQLGIIVSGFMVNKLGYKWTQLVCLALSTALTFLVFFSHSLGMLCASYFFQGLPWGIYQVVAPGYAADVASLKLRPVLLAGNNLSWALGQLCGSIALYAFEPVEGTMSYKGPFAIQWAFCGILLVWTMLVPETSYWQMQHGKYQQARQSLRWLLWKASAERIDEKMAQLAHNIHQERHRHMLVAEARKDSRKKSRNPFQRIRMFSGVDLRRTEIAVVTWVIQSICGSSLAPWCPVFMQRAGLKTGEALQTNMAMCGLAVIGTCCSWVLMSYVGRRTAYGAGLISLSICLAVLGSLGFIPNISGWAAGAILIIIALVYQLTIGPFCYSIVAEIPSITLRPHTLALARFCYNLTGMAQHVLVPKMLLERQWNLGAKTGLPFAVTAFLSFLYTWFRIPETKNISPRQIDILFEGKAATRKFSSEEANRLDVNMHSKESIRSDSTAGTMSTSGASSGATESSQGTTLVLNDVTNQSGKAPEQQQS